MSKEQQLAVQKNDETGFENEKRKKVQFENCRCLNRNHKLSTRNKLKHTQEQRKLQ